MADVVLLERRTTGKDVAGFVCFYFLSEKHVIKGRALFFLLAISTPANADKTERGWLLLVSVSILCLVRHLPGNALGGHQGEGHI